MPVFPPVELYFKPLFSWITSFSVMIRYYIFYNPFLKHSVEIVYKVKTKKLDALKWKQKQNKTN